MPALHILGVNVKKIEIKSCLGSLIEKKTLLFYSYYMVVLITY